MALLARMLSVKPNVIQYAGTKDKRGITCQRATVHQIEASRMRSLNAGLRGIRVGDFQYVSNALQLGELSGNRFDIVLRYVAELLAL
jgi:tRNA pseudouridine13 synthase